jgi:hypothetical protein
MTAAPGISLIIPAYNAARYLREVIDSALNQTGRPDAKRKTVIDVFTHRRMHDTNETVRHSADDAANTRAQAIKAHLPRTGGRKAAT